MNFADYHPWNPRLIVIVLESGATKEK